MKKLVIRQGGSSSFHIPSKTQVDKILSANVCTPYKIKSKGSTLSIQFEQHITHETCNVLAEKLGLNVSYLSSVRSILSLY